MFEIVQEYCIRHGYGPFWNSWDGLVCMACELPDDYETCEDCGHDHSYEYPEAHQYHSQHLDNTDL